MTKMKSFRDVMKSHGIQSIDALAKGADMSPQNAWNYWHGYTKAGVRTAWTLWQRLGIPMQETIDSIPNPDYGTSKR